MIKTKILQFFICHKTSAFKTPKHLVTGFVKVLYQISIKFNFLVNMFVPQLLSSFHKIVVSVPNYHTRSIALFFITRFRSCTKENIVFQSSLLNLEYVCCFLGGFPQNLVLKHGTSQNCGVSSFQKYHLFLIRQQKSEKYFLSSGLFLFL